MYIDAIFQFNNRIIYKTLLQIYLSTKISILLSIPLENSSKYVKFYKYFIKFSVNLHHI